MQYHLFDDESLNRSIAEHRQRRSRGASVPPSRSVVPGGSDHAGSSISSDDSPFLETLITASHLGSANPYAAPRSQPQATTHTRRWRVIGAVGTALGITVLAAW